MTTASFQPPSLLLNARNTQKNSNTILATVDAGGNSISLELRRAGSPLRKDKSLPPKYKQFCGLAQSITGDGMMGVKAMHTAMETLHHIAGQLQELQNDGHNVALRAVGTAPFRDAKDGMAFVRQIHEETGLPLEVISGDQEAVYAARGALAHFPGISGIVVDTGGGSSEFCCIEDGEIKDTFSLPLGMLRIASAADAKAYIEEQLDQLPDDFLYQTTLISTGGTNRALAKAYAGLQGIKLRKANESCVVKAKDYAKFAHSLAETSPDALTSRFKIKSERTAQIQPATLLLDALRDRLGVQEIVLNKATMRDGIRAEMIEALNSTPKSAPQVSTEAPAYTDLRV